MRTLVQHHQAVDKWVSIIPPYGNFQPYGFGLVVKIFGHLIFIFMVVRIGSSDLVLIKLMIDLHIPASILTIPFQTWTQYLQFRRH